MAAGGIIRFTAWVQISRLFACLFQQQQAGSGINPSNPKPAINFGPNWKPPYGGRRIIYSASRSPRVTGSAS